MPIAPVYIATGMLLIGILPMPYGYYTLLRLVATVIFAWAAYIGLKRGDSTAPWINALLALLFNPLIPIHMPKPVWAATDLGAAIWLLATKRRITQSGDTQQT